MTAPTLEDRRGATATEPIDPRIAARRDEVARDHGRRRRRRLVAVGIVSLVIAGLWYATRSPLLDIDRIQVEGNEHTTTDEILASAGLAPGDQMIDIDAGRVREHLLALPWVADASVKVNWPGKVRVSITERTPVAVLPAAADDADSRVLLVDGDGRVLDRVGDPGGLLPIEGVSPVEPGEYLDPSVKGALTVIGLLQPGTRSRVQAVVVRPDGQLEMRLSPLVVVKLGPPTDLEAKIAALTTVLGQVDGTALAGIDVLIPDLPVVHRFPPAADAGSAAGTATTTVPPATTPSTTPKAAAPKSTAPTTTTTVPKSTTTTRPGG